MEQLVIIFQNISLIGIIRYSYILIINIIVILYFIKLKDLNINKFYNLKNIIFFLIFTSLPIYLIALDWGRITYLSFNFIIILILFLNNNNLINEKLMNDKIKYLSKKYKIFIFTFICVLFSPKILLNDDFSGLPIYKITLKILKIVNFNL